MPMYYTGWTNDAGHLVVTVMRGIQFAVRIVRTGDRYGRDLTHDDPRPMVEFYDMRHPQSTHARGQFVSRYFAEDLRNIKGGLNLHGGEPDWSLDAEACADVLTWLDHELGTADKARCYHEFCCYEARHDLTDFGQGVSGEYRGVWGFCAFHAPKKED